MVLVLLAQLSASPLAAQLAAPTTEPEMLEYLAQSACLDGDGKLTQQLPNECDKRRLLHEDDPLPWRRHDWGGAIGPSGGWQASDAVLAKRQDVLFVDQTFDFGAPAVDTAGHPDAYFRFDANDGGDAIMIVGDTASIFLTQDGGTPGLQWFIGPDCAQPGRRRYVSWLLFKTDIGANWREAVAELSDIPQNTCPKRFNRAFTRYRLVAEAFPFQRLGTSATPTRWETSLPTIVVEHFDGPSLARSHAMERFYYARGFGKLRWESWDTDRAKAAQAELFSRSERCAPLSGSTPPGDAWKMIDCRMWTNIVSDPTRPNWRVREFNWPPADLPLQ